MCCSLLAKAMITFPRLLKLLLILFVSRNRSPVEPELLKRSDPARSIRFRVPANWSEYMVNRLDKQWKIYGRHFRLTQRSIPWHFSPVRWFSPTSFSLKTLWLREERSLHCVAATALFWVAFSNKLYTCNKTDKNQYEEFSLTSPLNMKENKGVNYSPLHRSNEVDWWLP